LLGFTRSLLRAGDCSIDLFSGTSIIGTVTA